MNYIFNRIREPSTWASVAALAAIIAPQHAANIGAAGAALGTLAGILGAALPDPKKPQA